jgi:hypothetical protein
MRQDDIDRRLADALLKNGIMTEERLVDAADRSIREKTTLTRALVAEAGTFASASVIAILRFLHAGFECQDPDSLERHEDRLLARFAVRSGELEKEAMKAAFAEQDARRTRGEPIRLGDLLIEKGVLERATAEKVQRRYEKRVFTCPSCFAPSPRDYQSGASWAKECLRCGREARAPKVGERPGWVSGGGKTPSAPRVSPPPLPSPAPRGRGFAAAGGGAVLLVLLLAAGILAWRGAAAREVAARWDRFAAGTAEADARKASGRVAEAALAYGAAVRDVEGLPTPDAARGAAVEAARAARDLCDEFASCEREGSATRFGELARACHDPAVLLAVCDALSRQSGDSAAPALVVLAKSSDAAVASRAVAVGVKRGGVPALPLLELAVDSPDEVLAREGALAAIHLNDPRAVAVLAKVLDRFPRNEDFAVAIGEQASHWKDATAVPLLRRLARAEWVYLSEPALRLLVALHPPDAIPELLLALEGPQALRAASIEALRSMGDDAIPALGRALAKGQTAAARALLAIETPAAIDIVADALPRLPWQGRQAVLEAVIQKNPPPAALKAPVTQVVDEARAACESRSAELARPALVTFSWAARLYGLREATNYFLAEIFFDAHEDADGTTRLETKHFGREDRTGLEGQARLELRNWTKLDVVMYARGAKPGALRATAGASRFVLLPPGDYLVGSALLKDSRELYPAIGKVHLAAGRITYLQYGDAPSAPAGASGTAGTAATAASDEERKQRFKRAMARAFRKDQFFDEARKQLAKGADQPWPKSQETVVATQHYKITSDAGKTVAADVGREIEAAYREYVKFVPATPADEPYVVRFFATQAAFETWRSKTDLVAMVERILVTERSLAARARTVAQRGKSADPALAAQLEDVAKALESPLGLGGVTLEDLDAFDDALEALEGATKIQASGLGGALTAVKSASLLSAAAGKNLRGVTLGFFNPSNKELCIWLRNGWVDTVRHEAFHQFFCSRATSVPSWLNEGLATYFEVYPKSGRNQSRIDELKRADAQAPGFLDRIDLVRVIQTTRLTSLDYALSWSFVFYLVDQEPQALAKILARARDGQASTAGVVSVFDDFMQTFARWRAATKKLALGE